MWNMLEVIKRLHHHLATCEYVGPGGKHCAKCAAVMAALSELENVAEWREASEEVERTQLEVSGG